MKMKKEQDRLNQRAKELWEAEVQFLKRLDKIAKKSPRDAVKMLIEGMRAKLDMIEFSLITQYEAEGIKETELGYMETDPLGCLDLYVNSIRRKFIWLEHIAMFYRAQEIRKMRKEYKLKKGTVIRCPVKLDVKLSKEKKKK